jgi:hypothetical protein
MAPTHDTRLRRIILVGIILFLVHILILSVLYSVASLKLRASSFVAASRTRQEVGIIDPKLARTFCYYIPNMESVHDR